MATLSLRNLPELPANSVIQVEETPEGLELRWLNPRGRIFAGREAGLLGLFVLGFWVVTGLIVGWQLGQSLGREVPSPEAFGWFRWAFLGMVVAVGVFVSLHLVITLGSRRAEVLLLTQDRFLHRLGSSPFSFGRSQITEVSLPREAARPQLKVVIGADAIEVGRYLPQPDREWLAEVLRLWLAQG